MMNPKDLRSSKMSEALGLFNLPEEQLGTAEAYILQEEGEEGLKRLAFQDLSSIPSE